MSVINSNIKNSIFGGKKREYGMVFVFLGMCLISAIISPVFRSLDNILNILNQNAIYGIMAIGMCFVLVIGGIDLSVGSVVALTGVIATPLFREYGFVAGLLGGLAIGVAVGSINGFLITKVKVNPFISTLGTMTIARGTVYIITNGFPEQGVPVAYNVIGMGRLWEYIPVAALIWLVLIVIMSLVLKYTRFGQYVFAIGGNENAAWLSGVNTQRIKLFTYLTCGLFASIGGIILNLRVLMATADAATGYELNVIAGCIVGGIAMDGGRGSVLGSVIGTLILGLILNMLQLIGVSSYWQNAITGLIIVTAVSIDSLSKRKRD